MSNEFIITPTVTDETREKIIRETIKTQKGWQSLAQSIKSSNSPSAAKDLCIEVFKKIAGNKTLEMPMPIFTGTDEDFHDSSSTVVEKTLVPLIDLLVEQLEDNLNALSEE